MYENHIERIVKSLETLSEVAGAELASVSRVAASAAKASASRAQIPNTRLGNAAAFSVAASIANPLKTYLSQNERDSRQDALLRDALNAALDLSVTVKKRSIEDLPASYDIPDGWSSETIWVMTKPTDYGMARISYNPHMPGGDWTLSIRGIAVGYGVDPSDAASEAQKIIEFLSEPIRIAKNPQRMRFRNGNLAKAIAKVRAQ